MTQTRYFLISFAEISVEVKSGYSRDCPSGTAYYDNSEQTSMSGYIGDTYFTLTPYDPVNYPDSIEIYFETCGYGYYNVRNSSTYPALRCGLCMMYSSDSFPPVPSLQRGTGCLFNCAQYEEEEYEEEFEEEEFEEEEYEEEEFEEDDVPSSPPAPAPSKDSSPPAQVNDVPSSPPAPAQIRDDGSGLDPCEQKRDECAKKQQNCQFECTNEPGYFNSDCRCAIDGSTDRSSATSHMGVQFWHTVATIVFVAAAFAL
jgi:hypothetical protein